MQFCNPQTIEEAVSLLKSGGNGAHVLAGGTDLLVRMRGGYTEPKTIVDIKSIKGMDVIKKHKGGWRIGAAVSGAQMGEHDGLMTDWPGVVEATELIGSTQIQGRATMAGNMCNASPAADSVPAMVAAGAEVLIEGPSGSRDVAVEKFLTGPGKTVLKRGEFVSGVFLPKAAKRVGSAYLRFIPRTEMDIAVVGCGVMVKLDAKGRCTDARVALGAVGPKVMLVPKAAKAMIGNVIDDDVLQAVSEACSDAASPISDKRGTVEFRKEVSGVLARRAINLAVTRAGERA